MRLRLVLAVATVAVVAAGCHTDMWVQPRLKPMEPAENLPNGSSSQPPVPGTVAIGHLNDDDVFYKGRTADGKLVRKMPLDKTMRLLHVKDSESVVRRGQELFNAFCSPCHGALGDGKGMIAKRGLDLRRTPANYHTARLRNMPDGHFYDVITNGFGVMFPYSSRIVPEDRWAIVSYIRTLQLSQNAGAEDVPPASETATTTTEGGGH